MPANEEFQPSAELTRLKQQNSEAWEEYQAAKREAETKWFRVWNRMKELEQRETVIWKLKQEGVIQ